jgi:hypothetical protein
MSQEIVHQEDVVTIYWDTEARHHVARWQGFAHGEPFRAAFEACIRAAQARPSTKWLADVRKYSVTTPEDQQWIVERFFPGLVDAGIRHFAVIAPEKVVASMAAQRVLQAFAGGELEFGYHASEKEAMTWLRERPDMPPGGVQKKA